MGCFDVLDPSPSSVQKVHYYIKLMCMTSSSSIKISIVHYCIKPTLACTTRTQRMPWSHLRTILHLSHRTHSTNTIYTNTHSPNQQLEHYHILPHNDNCPCYIVQHSFHNMDHRRSANVSHCYCRLSRERVLPHNYVHTHGHTASIVLSSCTSHHNYDM